MSYFISLERVLSNARAQMEGLTKHPDLEKGLPCPLADLSETFDDVFAAEKSQEELKKLLVLATRNARRARRALLEKVRANLAIAVLRYGPDAEPVSMLGGKPRGRPRHKAKNGKEGPAT